MNPARTDLPADNVSRRDFCRAAALAGGALLVADAATGAETPTSLKLTAPVPRQVIQRQGYRPAEAHDHNPEGAKLGEGVVLLQGTWTGPVPVRLEARTILQTGCTGTPLDWTVVATIMKAGEFQHELKVPAGGWYRLEVRALSGGGQTIGDTAVDPVGIGEVFLISGQSYAAGANDERMRIDDSLERTVLLDYQTKAWRTAHDPFPHVDDGGTIWPPFANLIQPLLRVPVGLCNVAVGGTASRQWLPGEPLFQRFLDGGNALGWFRFVLWQQGESDVIEHIPTATYVDRLLTIRTELAKQWGFDPAWLPAKSTIHPTVYNVPVDEARIRAAIAELWTKPGFYPGPDTDILDGENRGGPMSRRHFSPIGQRRAGLMWLAAVWSALNTEAAR